MIYIYLSKDGSIAKMAQFFSAPNGVYYIDVHEMSQLIRKVLLIAAFLLTPMTPIHEARKTSRTFLNHLEIHSLSLSERLKGKITILSDAFLPASRLRYPHITVSDYHSLSL